MAVLVALGQCFVGTQTGGNDFHAKQYTKVPNAFFPLDVTYDDVGSS